MDEFQFLRHEVAHAVHVAIFTRDLLHADAMNEALTLDTSFQPRSLILDFQDIRQMVSGSLYPESCPFGPLFKLRKQMSAEGRRLALCGMDTKVQEFFRTTKLDQVFDIYSDLDSAMREMQDGSSNTRRLSVVERWKVVAVAFAFWTIFTALFGLILATGEPMEPLRKYPLDPEGWFVVRYPGGTIVREANMWDMIKAKYWVLLFLGGYTAVILFSAYVVLLGALGRRSRITKWVLRELSSDASFRLTGERRLAYGRVPHCPLTSIVIESSL